MVEHDRSFREIIIQYFNVETAKRIAFCMVVALVLYHGTRRLRYGNDSCKRLLTNGGFHGHNKWLPYGCMMHYYSARDARTCMLAVASAGHHNHIVFMGDSRVRELFYEFVNMFWKISKEQRQVIHHNISFSDEHLKLKVEFLWQPFVNMAMNNIYQTWAKKAPTERPSLIVTGAALWDIRLARGRLESIENYLENLDRMVPHFEKLQETTKLLWRLQSPIEDEKLIPQRNYSSNALMNHYNKGTLDVLENSPTEIWSSSRLVSLGVGRNTIDGVHEVPLIVVVDTQILFNMYCNNRTTGIMFRGRPCCTDTEPVVTIQIMTAVGFGLCLIIALPLWVYHRCRNISRRNGNRDRCDYPPENGESKAWIASVVCRSEQREKGYYVVLTSLAKLGFIMAYIFTCDRSDLFMKENKVHTLLHFILPFATLMVVGLFFTKDSEDTSLLHRNQTDEWKGWLQLAILIYHISGGCLSLPIYMFVRVLVSAYFFLSGYAHFTYFWKTGNFRIQRVCQILFRMNMLIVCVCLTMNRPYQLYYFIPLVTYWFLCVYVTMVGWPLCTAQKAAVHFRYYIYMLVKLTILAGIVTELFIDKALFETLFRMKPFKALFVREDGTIKEWRFRWQLDRYSVIYGIVFSFVCQCLKKLNVLNDSGRENLFPREISFFVTLVALLGIAMYTCTLCSMFWIGHMTAGALRQIHSYIVFLPIISYIFLRNTYGFIRTKYSIFFAWFGKMSLELYIVQFHIWLAADSRGILVLIPGNQLANIIITTFILICTCHELHKITSTLSKYAVPNDRKIALRNSVLFFLILIASGWKLGAF